MHDQITKIVHLLLFSEVFLPKIFETAVFDQKEKNPVSVVQRVVSRERLDFFGSPLIVSAFQDEAMVKISGIDKPISTEALTLFFESKKSEGGDVRSVDLFPAMNCAIITFEEETGMRIQDVGLGRVSRQSEA